jgi:tetratricopeptide (TPR) repeat protein
MEEFKETVQAEPEAYSRHFRITGQTCSLLMLESEADYQRFNIKPQEDAFVVKITNASEVIAKQIKKSDENAAHAKARFMSALEKLKKVPLMNFNLSTAFQMTLDKMPDESFVVQPKALKCKIHTLNDIPGIIREQLASGKLDYETLSLKAENRKSKYGNDDALKTLSSLIEQNPNDPALCRDIAFTAMEMGFGSHAYHLLRRVAEIRPHEFILYREMALCLTDIGKADLALAYYEIASNSEWNGRAGEFATILNMDYLRLLKMIDKGKLTSSVKDYAEVRLKKLAEKPDPKPPIVVIATWNTDKTDVDLHVTEPDGEECYYNRKTTKRGGHITRDVTDGYGPEMYMSSESAESGTYKVSVQYFSSDQNRASTRSKVYVSIYQYWGTPNEKLISKSVALTGQKQMIDVAKTELEPSFINFFQRFWQK